MKSCIPGVPYAHGGVRVYLGYCNILQFEADLLRVRYSAKNAICTILPGSLASASPQGWHVVRSAYPESVAVVRTAWKTYQGLAVAGDV